MLIKNVENVWTLTFKKVCLLIVITVRQSSSDCLYLIMIRTSVKLAGIASLWGVIVQYEEITKTQSGNPTDKVTGILNVLSRQNNVNVENIKLY